MHTRVFTRSLVRLEDRGLARNKATTVLIATSTSTSVPFEDDTLQENVVVERKEDAEGGIREALHSDQGDFPHVLSSCSTLRNIPPSHFHQIDDSRLWNKARMAPYSDGVMETPKKKYERRIIWPAVIIYGSFHLAALYGVYLLFTSAKLMTTAFALGLYIFCAMGVTAGAHRLWSHRAYKAKWPLQVLLMILQTTTFQWSIINWARDHRLHHKYSDTNADPHNPNRGFFFAHIGWMMCTTHPDVKEKGKGVDINDLTKDPLLAFQKRYYIVLMPLLCYFIPTIVPVLCWNETWLNAFFVSGILRCVSFWNAVWLINSAGHTFGNRPYDKFINPSENMIANVFIFGEGWHNYHHVFPWDYRTSELGSYGLDTTAGFIYLFAKIGWAYDLKVVPIGMVQRRVKRTGDGSHEVWGWGDADQTQEDKDQTVVIRRLKGTFPAHFAKT